MDRNDAMTLVLAEAFSNAGLAILVENSEDPGWERFNRLIEVLTFLADELAGEDHLGRELISALFVLGNRVPDLMRQQQGVDSRPSLYEQAEALTTAVTALIENWDHWPDAETYEFESSLFEARPADSPEGPPAEKVGGYRAGDITYCVIANTMDCYPVRVERLGNGYLDVRLLDAGSAEAGFMQDAQNRRFFYPTLSPGARFGGDDERLVNSNRTGGPELRLLPTQYASNLLQHIRERHAADPAHWPLPTGEIFERWFQDRSPREA